MSFNIDDVDIIETCLSDASIAAEIEPVLAIALRNILIPSCELLGLTVPIFNKVTAAKYLRVLWLKKSCDDTIVISSQDNLIYMIPFLISNIRDKTQFADTLNIASKELFSTAVDTAYRNANFDVVKLLMQMQAGMNKVTLDWSFDSETLKQLAPLKTVVDGHRMWQAARYGSLELFGVFEQVSGIAPDDSMLEVAIYSGNADLVSYIESRGVEVEIDDCFRDAILSGHLHLVKKYHAAEAKMQYDYAADKCVEYDHVDVMRYLFEQKLEEVGNGIHFVKSPEMLQLFIDFGAQPSNEEILYSICEFLYRTSNTSVIMIEMLLRNGLPKTDLEGYLLANLKSLLTNDYYNKDNAVFACIFAMLLRSGLNVDASPEFLQTMKQEKYKVFSDILRLHKTVDKASFSIFVDSYLAGLRARKVCR